MHDGHPFQTQLNIHIYTSCTFYLAQELAPLTTQKVHWQLNYWDYKKGLAAFSIMIYVEEEFVSKMFWYFTQLTVTLLNCRKVWSNLSHISSRFSTIFCK